MRVKLMLSKESEVELVQRSNYLGVSLSSFVLLQLVLYEPSNVRRDEYLTFLNNEDKRSLQIELNDNIIQKFDSQPLFNNPLYIYLSIHLSKVVNETKKEWKEKKSLDKENMKFSTYQLSKKLVDKIAELKKRTNLTLTTFINYAATLQSETQPNNDERKRQGVQLSEPIYIEIRKDTANIGKALEGKMEYLFKTLEKEWNV